jgi:hypothetical protein
MRKLPWKTASARTAMAVTFGSFRHPNRSDFPMNLAQVQLESWVEKQRTEILRSSWTPTLVNDKMPPIKTAKAPAPDCSVVNSGAGRNPIRADGIGGYT